jgi:response regulator RpfG family c-di-GMP phosphodiesterase
MASILVVDDDELVRRAVDRSLTRAGHRCFTAQDGESALAEIDRHTIDVLLADYQMPGMNGVHLLRTVGETHPDLVRILFSGNADYLEACAAVNQGGAHRILAKPFEMVELVRTIEQAIEMRRLRKERDQLEEQLALSNLALRRQNVDLERELATRTTAALDGLISALDLRDTETQWHSRRVSLYARRLGLELGLAGQALLDVTNGALLHDVGKIGVRDAVLLKPSALSPLEWQEMRRHPSLGFEILRRIEFLRGAAEVVLSHHERWDGSGYPRGLRGEEIVIGARIFSVVDTFDAITSDRPYRAARDYSVAREEIIAVSGTQFDPRVAEAFLAVPEADWAAIRLEVELSK